MSIATRSNEPRTEPFAWRPISFGGRFRRIGAFCLRPTTLLLVLLVVHLGSRLALHRISPLSGAHNYDRAYGVSLSLLAGRGFNDIVVDDSPASAPIQEFFDLKRSRISRDEFAAYLASHPDSARDPFLGRFLPLATIRVADIRLAAVLWRVFGIDRYVLAAFYSIFSMATCGCVFLIARRITGSGWAGLAAAMLVTISPIEAFLNTWSWRDVSPMWFTAASFAWFTCAIERSRRPAVNLAAYWILGMLAVIGIGWRIDALLLAPFLAACVVARLIVARAGWRKSLAAIACLVLGAYGTRAAVLSLGPTQSQTPNIGFHMAFYADFPRSELLGIENSFEVLFSDMQTLDYARQIHQADHPHAELLKYLSPDYCDICRKMLLEEASYNAFQWTYRFPKIYWQMLGGLDSQSMIGEIGSQQIQKDLPSPLRQLFGRGDWLGHAIPVLFCFGALATIFAGRQKMAALSLFLFSIYYAGIMFLVLPDQKHLGVLLVPLYAFAGAGIYAIGRLLPRRTWRSIVWAEWRLQARRVAISAMLIGAVWGIACVWARGHSVARRAMLLREVRERTATGVDAPETLRGNRCFAVAIRPDSTAGAAGYLLKISAGAKPGTLLCRQFYFPRDWAHLWGRELITRHKLAPNREQSFFVSCIQGPLLGDPCAHECTVAIDGDAKILGSTRVSMTDWDHPQFCTLFYDGQNSPGSPVIGANATEWIYVASRPFADQSPDRVLSNRSGMFDVIAPVQAPQSAGRPLSHVIGRNADTGNWKVAMSDGWRFSFLDMNYWSPAKNWLQLETGDFNGDGLTDLVAQAPDGQWWLGLANGGYHSFASAASLPHDGRFDFVGVGDFDGDGLDDLILRSTDGHWTLALATGDGFQCQSIGDLPAVAKENLLIGDFLGNGRKQLAALDSQTGHWTIAGLDGTRGLAHLPMSGEKNVPVPIAGAAAQSAGPRWFVRPWGDFPAGAHWGHAIAADFCGTGHAAVAAWSSASGAWIVGNDVAGQLTATQFGKWDPSKTWTCVAAGLFGDGVHADIVALDASTGEICVAQSDGRRFTTHRYPGHAAIAGGFHVGAFSGNKRDELLGIAADGRLWVGKFEIDVGDKKLADDDLRFSCWGRWPDFEHMSDFRTIGVWPENRR